MIGHLLFLSVLYAYVFYCICTCSAQLSMFHMEKRSRNTLILLLLLLLIIIITRGQYVHLLIASVALPCSISSESCKSSSTVLLSSSSLLFNALRLCAAVYFLQRTCSPAYFRPVTLLGGLVKNPFPYV